VTGRKRSIIPLGDGLSYLQAWALEFKPGKKLMTRDNFYAMSVDNVCSGGWPSVFNFTPVALEAIAPNTCAPTPPAHATSATGKTPAANVTTPP